MRKLPFVSSISSSCRCSSATINFIYSYPAHVNAFIQTSILRINTMEKCESNGKTFNKFNKAILTVPVSPHWGNTFDYWCHGTQFENNIVLHPRPILQCKIMNQFEWLSRYVVHVSHRTCGMYDFNLPMVQPSNIITPNGSRSPFFSK